MISSRPVITKWSCRMSQAVERSAEARWASSVPYAPSTLVCTLKAIPCSCCVEHIPVSLSSHKQCSLCSVWLLRVLMHCGTSEAADRAAKCQRPHWQPTCAVTVSKLLIIFQWVLKHGWGDVVLKIRGDVRPPVSLSLSSSLPLSWKRGGVMQWKKTENGH
jgi:hypothetical protein